VKVSHWGGVKGGVSCKIINNHYNQTLYDRMEGRGTNCHKTSLKALFISCSSILPCPPLWHVGVFNLWHKHIKANITLVLLHSGIVNGYQLLCDAHTVLEPHRETAAFFLFYSPSSFSTFSFMFLSLIQFYFFSWVPL